MSDQDGPIFQATRLSAAYDGITTLPVVVMLENVRSLYNVGAFFRTADAVKAERLLLAGITAGPTDPRVAKTALGAEASVPSLLVADVVATIAEHRRRGYQVVGIETSATAVDLFDWVPSFPVVLVFGHEVEGVSPAALAACDVHVRIPTLGLKQSLNVATAGGVVLYELLRRYRALVTPGRAGDVW